MIYHPVTSVTTLRHRLYVRLTGWHRTPAQVQHYDNCRTPIWYGQLEDGKISCLEIRVRLNVEIVDGVGLLNRDILGIDFDDEP